MHGPHNPYQPPITSAAPPPASTLASQELPAFAPAELEEARRRLRAHCADAAALQADRAAEGSLLRPATIVLLVLALLALAAVAAAVVLHSKLGVIFAIIGAVLFGIIALSLVIIDLGVGRRSAATEAVVALRRWFRAAKASHAGYLFCALAPTAREGHVEAPAVGGAPSGERFPTRSKQDLKRYLKSWARPDNKWVRWTRVKKIELLEQERDRARVRVELELTAWPQWANILSVIAFVLVRVVGIVLAIVLYYALRKVQKLQSEKTLLRGDDGLWYLLDADLRR